MLALIEMDRWGVKFTKEQCDALKAAALTAVEFEPEGEQFRLSGYNPQYIVTLEDMADLPLFKIVRMFPKLGRIQPQIAPIINEKCQVAVGGVGMLSVDEIKNMDDCCTDALRREMQDGWRILAICVQPNQRRPDYILGRTR